MNVVAGAGPEVIKVSDNCSSPVRSDQWPVSVSQYLILPATPLQPLAHWSTSPINIGRPSGFNLITIHSSIIQISPSSLLWAADTWLVAVGLIEISGNKTVRVRSTPTPTAQFRTKVPASNMNILLQSTLLAMAYISGIRGISNMEPMSRKEFCKKIWKISFTISFRGCECQVWTILHPRVWCESPQQTVWRARPLPQPSLRGSQSLPLWSLPWLPEWPHQRIWRQLPTPWSPHLPWRLPWRLPTPRSPRSPWRTFRVLRLIF